MAPATDDPCGGCGLCCAGQGTPPFTRCGGDSPPPHLEWDIESHKWRYDDGLPCLWYDAEGRRCRHYDHRPLACREAVVPGDESCNEFRAGGGLLPLLFAARRPAGSAQ